MKENVLLNMNRFASQFREDQVKNATSINIYMGPYLNLKRCASPHLEQIILHIGRNLASRFKEIAR